MPRVSRKESQSGIYHVMLRGINGHQIFEDVEDNEKFLEILKDCKSMSGFKLYAYCLMGNHVHLLLKTGDEDLSRIFKRVGTRYVYWYNSKYRRAGHLFQDRFKSEPIEDDEYFLTALRYIHQNPVKAKITDRVDSYRWSSFGEYINKPQIAYVKFTLKMIGRDEFIRFHNVENDDICLEISDKKTRSNDNDVKELMEKLFNCSTVDKFQNIGKPERDSYVKRLKEEGISIRQISRLTGVSKGIVERI
jgi:REP element-mobilizing transposase RayT